MALTVNTNLASLNALNHTNRTNKALGNTFAKISSGLRINKAADDSAGLAVWENLDATSRSLTVAMRNANDGISAIQVAEGAVNEVSQIIKRMRELAVQSGSETLHDDERAYIQDEYVELAAEAERIAQVTNFNGVDLSLGTTTMLDVQVGVNDSANDRITINLGDLRSTTLGIDSGSLDLSTAAKAQSALTDLDDALDTLLSYRSSFGAVQNRLESALRNAETYHENIEAAKSRIRDADFASETADMSKLQIMQQAGIAVLGQANQINSGATRLLG